MPVWQDSVSRQHLLCNWSMRAKIKRISNERLDFVFF